MRLPLLLFLALPLSAAAQMNGSSFGNSQFQASQRQAQMHRDFQRQTMERTMARSAASSTRAQLALSKEQREKRMAKQHEAELKATAELARLSRRQDSLRVANPAPNATQTAARAKADEQALAQLTVRNYRDVFLPGQVMVAEDARSLSEDGIRNWQSISKDLSDNDWWRKQDPAQLLAKVATYRTSLTALTTDLLGFDPAAAPKSLRIPSSATLEAMSTFDQQVATKYLQDVVRFEKEANSLRLVRILNDFNREVTEAAARPENQQDPQKMRSIVKSGMSDLNKAMLNYEMAMARSQLLNKAQTSITDYATRFLPKNDKSAKKRG